MIHYVPIKQRLYSDELGSYLSYGIAARDDENQTVLSVSDVSPDEQFVAGLCDRCNRYLLDPIHLFDVISDSI